MKVITIGESYATMVDDSTFGWAKQISWSLAKSRERRYVQTSSREYLHRLISVPSGMEEVDHENGNTLDNRKLNLRNGSSSQNNQAFHRKADGKTSVYRGVSWRPDRNRWRAVIQLEGKKQVRLGHFLSEEVAAYAYDVAAKKYFGSYAHTNLIGPPKPLTYLAVPYSHSDSKIVETRFEKVTQAAALLTRAGGAIFSPITSSHCLTKFSGLAGSWEFWKHTDYTFLGCCGLMIVLTLEGWKESVGVSAELAYAKKANMQVEFLDENNLLYGT
jgi:hypothetical protein